jgi:hypothetical protein
VTFNDGTTALGTATLSGGSATFTTSSLAIGSHSITVDYPGDAVYGGSSASALAQVVNKYTTLISVSSGTNPSTFGGSVTFTATVSSSGGTPTGTVTFKDGVTTLGSGTLAAGSATFATSALAVGPHSITAEYGGAPSFEVSTSTTLTQTVNPATTVPGAPTIGTATAGNAQATVTFSGPASDGGSAITSYTATSSPGGLTGSCSAPCTSINVGGLTNGVAYTFTVTATNGIGTGSPSAASNSVTPVAPLTAQTITFAPLASRTLANSPFTVSATASSNLAVTFSSQTQSVCTVSGNTVTLVTTGPCTIAADQAGNGTYSPAPQVTRTFTVSPAPVSTNVALASAGAVATASSTYNTGYPVSAIINDERTGANWGHGGGWADGTLNVWPDYVEIAFNGFKTIDMVVVDSVQDNYTNPVEPTEAMTFTKYGVQDFTVEGRTSGGWVTLGTVTNNNLVERTVSFAETTVDRIRVTITRSLSVWSLLTEVEAWGYDAGAGLPSTSTTLVSSSNPSPPGQLVDLTATVSGSGSTPTGSVNFTDNGSPIAVCNGIALNASGVAVCSINDLTAGPHSIVAHYLGDANNAGSSSPALAQTVTSLGGSSNVALASAGGVASASSTYGSGYPVSAINNNERAGANWGNGGGWADATLRFWPDMVEISFAGNKTIDRVVVYSVQDNYANPVEPSDVLTFTQYGVQDFTIEGRNGGVWSQLATVSNNNLVKRTVNFPATTVDRIRITITRSLSAWSLLTEVEAWGVAAGAGLQPTATTLISSHNPSTAGQTAS